MSDFGWHLVGLTAATAFIAFGVFRAVKAVTTGVFDLGGGIRIIRNEEPRRYAVYTALQLLALLIFVYVYVLLLYNQFISDVGWMSR